jgi:predicted site-specific integrase-resolvase
MLRQIATIGYNRVMADLVRLTDAAAEFDLHRATLYRYVRDGRLTAYERGIGRGTYIDRDELRKLAEIRPTDVEGKR